MLKTSSKHFEEDVLNMSWRPIENILKTSWRHFCKTSWRRLEGVLKTSWKRLEDVLKTSWRHLKDVLKTFLQDVLKTFWRRLGKRSWSRLENVLKMSWRYLEDVWPKRLCWSWSRRLWSRRLEDVFWRRRRKTSCLHQDECLLGTSAGLFSDVTWFQCSVLTFSWIFLTLFWIHNFQVLWFCLILHSPINESDQQETFFILICFNKARITDLTCSDNSTQTESSRRGMVVDFEGAKRLLEHYNAVELKLPKMHQR